MKKSPRIDVILILIWSLLLLTSSCGDRLSHKAYVKWLRDYENKAHVLVHQGDFNFDLQYQPSEYVLLQRGVQYESDSARANALKALSATQYYTLTISRADKDDLVGHGANSKEEKEERQYYLSYHLQDAVTLEDNGKMLPCVLFHSEKPAIANGGRTFLLAFENVTPASIEATLKINSGFFGSSAVNIVVNKSNIPSVDL